MLNKNSFYHLHIPKTGGETLNLFFTNNLVDYFIKNKIEYQIEGHFGLKPINKKTYTVTCFRDPIKRLVSHYCFMNLLNKKTNLDKEAKDFLLWFDDNKTILSNYQSKNLFYDSTDEYEPLILSGCSSKLSLKRFNLDDVKMNLSNIDIILKTETINSVKLSSVGEKILKDFNLELKAPFNISKEYRNSNPPSRILLSKLSKTDILYLEQENLIDFEIYNTNSLFF